MNDPCEEICDALVAHVNAFHELDPYPLSIKVQAAAPEDPQKEFEAESDDLQVFFVPYSESEEKIGRGGVCLELPEVSMMVTRKVGGQTNRRVMQKFVRELKVQLRGLPMAGWRYSTMETVSKFDLPTLHTRQRFVSVVRIHYVGTGGGAE